MDETMNTLFKKEFYKYSFDLNTLLFQQYLFLEEVALKAVVSYYELQNITSQLQVSLEVHGIQYNIIYLSFAMFSWRSGLQNKHRRQRREFDQSRPDKHLEVWVSTLRDRSLAKELSLKLIVMEGSFCQQKQLSP